MNSTQPREDDPLGRAVPASIVLFPLQLSACIPKGSGVLLNVAWCQLAACPRAAEPEGGFPVHFLGSRPAHSWLSLF